MHKLSEYLPEKSEYGARLSEALDPYVDRLWIVGSAARRYIYSLSSGTNGYDFILDEPSGELPTYFVSAVNEAGFLVDGGKKEGWYDVDCESFDFYIRPERITSFLCKSAYAGDALAVNVGTSMPIVLPEYMTMLPTVFIGASLKDDPQLKGEYIEAHVPVLKKFQDEILSQAQRELSTH